MSPWLPASLFAVVAWSLQRLLSKVALTTLGTRKFYLLSASVSLLAYLPYVAHRPPRIEQLPAAFGLACLMAVTFGVTTEAIRRGPLEAVSPITALSPGLTSLLGILVLAERPGAAAYVGMAVAPIGVALLSSSGDTKVGPGDRWILLALLSLVLQGIGAFIAKLVVTEGSPSALLLMGAAVQVVVGLFLAPPSQWKRSDLAGRPALYTVVAYAVGALATIGYLLALSVGPASLVVPLVATSPAIAGILGIITLHERLLRRQLVGVGLALAGAVLLAGA